jgi:hypothetical protein
MTPIVSMILTAVGTLAVLIVINRLRRQRSGGSGERPWQTLADDDTPVSEIAGWFEERRATAVWADVVSDATWKDLEGDALFRALDFTDTPLGRQMLYMRLREPDAPDTRALVEALAVVCAEDHRIRTAVRGALRDHRGSGGYRLHRLLRDRDLLPRWARLAPYITALLVLGLLLMPTIPRALIVVLPLALAGLTVRLVGMSRVGSYIGPLRELAPVLRAAEQLAGLVDTLPMAPEQRAALCAMLRPSVPLRQLRRIVRVVHPRFTLAEDVLASAYEYVNLLLLLDVNALLLCSRIMSRHHGALEQLCAAVGLFDVACAVAAYRSTRRWCTPTFATHTPTLRLLALQHPALPEGVTNDVVLERGRGLLLTGANMSGKSTLLRAIGVNVLLGRAIATCTAREAVLPVTHVLTSIGHTDDLERGVSYFYAEAQAVATLLRAAERGPALFLFDELFRGTNAAERVAAAEAVLRHITIGTAQGAPQWVALASHDLQLGELLADCFDVAHLAVSADGTSLVFEYRLQPGPATTRTALTLLARCGVAASVLTAARERAAALEAS